MFGAGSGGYLDHLMNIIQEQHKFFYMIKSKENVGDWFFFDIENEAPPYRVMWVPYMPSAFKFGSEQSVEEFKADYILPRKVEIVRIVRGT